MGRRAVLGEKLRVGWLLAILWIGQGIAGAVPPDLQQLARESVAEACVARLAGDDARFQAKLAEALARDPDCAQAQWLSGNVLWQGKWASVAQIEADVARDERYLQYRKLCAQHRDDADAATVLARWCAQHDLPEEARYLYRQVAQDPGADERKRAEACKYLQWERVDGQWMSAARRAELDQQAAAFRAVENRWSGAVDRWLRMIQRGRERGAALVDAQLAELDDVTAIPMLEERLSAQDPRAARCVVHWLAQRPEPESTESLVRHALVIDDELVQAAAVRALRDRPWHEYVPGLLSLLQAPLESRFAISVSAWGNVNHHHEVARTGQNGIDVAATDDLHAIWRPGAVRLVANRPTPTPFSRYRVAVGLAGVDGRDLSFDEQLQIRQAALLRRDLALIEASAKSAAIEQQVAVANQQTMVHNQPIYALLRDTTDAPAGDDPAAWWEWWDDYTEQYVPPKPIRFTYGWREQYEGPLYDLTVYRLSCFARDTTVRTLEGLRPIQELQPGDRVLAQDVDSGELAFPAVLAVTQRPAAPLLEIHFDETKVQATKGHPLWVHGQGWRMAKQLREGDPVQTLQGPRRVTQVREIPAQPAYNLVVDGFGSYFVSDLGVLAHDNLPLQPTLARTPGFPAPR